MNSAQTFIQNRTTCVIVDGPSKFDFFTSLGTRKHTVNFTIKSNPDSEIKRKLEVQVRGVLAEDGSHNQWLVALYVPSLNVNFKGFYSMTSRTGSLQACEYVELKAN